MNTNNKKNNILVLSEGPTQRLNDTTVTAEAKYSINFSISGRKLCLSLNYNENSIFLFVNSTKIYQFKVKGSETKPYPLCLGSISKDFTAKNMKNRIKWISLQLFRWL